MPTGFMGMGSFACPHLTDFSPLLGWRPHKEHIWYALLELPYTLPAGGKAYLHVYLKYILEVNYNQSNYTERIGSVSKRF